MKINLLKHQSAFLRAKEKNVLLLGGLGCLREDALVASASGLIPICDITQQDYVLSFDQNQNQFVFQSNSGAYPKGKDYLYRVISEHGEFVASGNHQIFSSDQTYLSVQDLYAERFPQACFYNPQLKNLSFSLKLSLSNVLHCWEKFSGLINHCVKCIHQYDLSLPSALNTFLNDFPLQADALKYGQFSYWNKLEHMDDSLEQELKQFHTSQLYGHQSMQDYGHLLADQIFVEEDEAFLSKVFEHILQDNRLFQQFLEKSYHPKALLLILYRICISLSKLLSKFHISNTDATIKKIEKLNKQEWYWDLQVPNTNNYIANGFIHHNSGKTKAGAVYAIQTAIQFPKAMGGIFANTYKQLQNSTLNSLFTTLMEAGITFEFNQNRGILRIGHTKILCQSLDNYDAIRGVELGWCWLDEASFAKEEAFTTIMGRVRDDKGPLQMRLTTTPQGFNWLWNWFANNKPDFKTIHAKTTDNPYLPDSYVKALYDQYDDKLKEQELEGKFVNITHGRIYYAFDRTKNVTSVKQNTNHPTIVGMDFNVNPMTAVICNVFDNNVNVWDEVWLKDSNTDEIGKYLKDKYGICSIVPDATGKALKTSAAGKSDHFILQQYGHKILPSRNPFRSDRFNAVNNLLSKSRLVIDNKCVKLIRDLEQVVYKEGSNLEDTSNPELTHISSALGYVIYYHFPLVSRIASVRSY